MKLGIVLFNLGGPDGLDAVEPFLRNLFSDPAIISLPAILRKPLARFLAGRRDETGIEGGSRNRAVLAFCVVQVIRHADHLPGESPWRTPP